MRVRLGWSGETEPNTWRKADVELEEQDLRRMFTEAGIDPSTYERAGTRVAYHLLASEAEILLLKKLLDFGYPVEKGSARIAELGKQITYVLDLQSKENAERVPA